MARDQGGPTGRERRAGCASVLVRPSPSPSCRRSRGGPRGLASVGPFLTVLERAWVHDLGDEDRAPTYVAGFNLLQHLVALHHPQVRVTPLTAVRLHEVVHVLKNVGCVRSLPLCRCFIASKYAGLRHVRICRFHRSGLILRWSGHLLERVPLAWRDHDGPAELQHVIRFAKQPDIAWRVRSLPCAPRTLSAPEFRWHAR